MKLRKILFIGFLFILIGILPYFLVWLHHIMVSGLNPVVGPALLILHV